MSQEIIERTFEVSAPAKLKLNNIRGSVDIQAGDNGVITVTATKYLDSGNADLTAVVIEQADDGSVVVKTDYQNSVTNWFGINKPCKVEYMVRVPQQCDLKVGNISGSATVQGITGNFDINSVSGGMTLSELTGYFKLANVSGSIKAENLDGELEANAVSGQVRIMNSNIPEATVKTVSGSITLQTPLRQGPYMLKGVSGRATLVVPEDTGCVAIHKSTSGRLKTSLPITQDKRYGSRGWLEIQGGGPEVTYKSISGSFKIVTAEDERIVERRVSQMPAPQPKNQMEILQKIEQGELSVEEAIKELNV